jgi:hypothetical protein
MKIAEGSRKSTERAERAEKAQRAQREVSRYVVVNTSQLGLKATIV